MKIELIPGVKSISGKSGNVLFKTYKHPNGKTETRAYLLPHRGERSTRKTALSESEVTARNLFKKRAGYVKQLTDTAKEQGRFLSKADAWKIAKEKIR